MTGFGKCGLKLLVRFASDEKCFNFGLQNSIYDF